MKKCPKCGTVYTDNTLSFCLSDGTPLTSDRHGQKTEVLQNPLVNMDTVDSIATRTRSSNAPTHENIVKSTKKDNRHGVSPLWILATFGLFGIVLAGIVIAWIATSGRERPENSNGLKNIKENSMSNNSNDVLLETPGNSIESNTGARNGPTPTPSNKPILTPTQSIASYRVVGVKSNDVLYIRPRAGNLKVVLGRIPPNGSGIRVVGRAKRVGRSTWFPIIYKGTRGWVNGRFISNR